MRYAWFTLAAGFLVARAAIPQDLPPGVLLLSRVRRHTEEELKRLPNISCLQTVRRYEQLPNARMRPLDVVRLEVLNADDKELFASPGERRFSEQPPIGYVGSGTMGDGYFGLYLKLVLLNNYVTYAFKGLEDSAGRRLARWDYRISPMWSGQTIELPEGKGTVGLHGSFWADPETEDVVRLELNGDEFPPSIPLTEAVWVIRYTRTLLDNKMSVLLPESGEFRMTRFTGAVSENRTEFTHCRAFGTESSIQFDEPGAAGRIPAFAVALVDQTLRDLPKGVQITVKLGTKISADMAVGTLIAGTVGANVPPKGKVLIAAGSPVQGRIRRLERYAEPSSHYIVALEFTELESQGIRYRFLADMVGMDSPPGVEATLSFTNTRVAAGLPDGGRQVRTDTETLTLPRVTGVASFFVKGDRLNLPQGFRTVWRTRSLK
jgi:hypothetical protein